MPWKAVAVAGGLVAALLGGQAGLPRLFEARVEEAVRQSVPAVQMVHAQVQATPALKLLAGRADSFSLDARGVRVGDLELDAFLVDARNLAVDLPRLLRGEGVAVRSADWLRVSMAVSEAKINEYFWARVDTSRTFRIELEPPGGARIVGSVRFLGATLDVTVRGRFAIQDRTKVVFQPVEVLVGRAELPEFLRRALAERWGLLIDFAGAPVPLEVRQVRVDQQALMVYGEKAG